MNTFYQSHSSIPRHRIDLVHNSDSLSYTDGYDKGVASWAAS
jgi:hypothetical protein